ncbi:MAG TPA: exosortase E/protease, VPEID-CTERM system [Steroidobacteraceae bacterium]|nr:exosortase E/protease, VPEID-CTERM system [Steroidobacteraceae bacterium]
MSAHQPISAAVTAAAPNKRGRMSLAGRAALLALVLFAEKFLLNSFVSFRAAQAATGLGTAARVIQHFGFRFLVSFAIALALFVYVRGDAALAALNDEARGTPVRLRWLALHGALLVPLAAALFNLYGTHGAHLPFAPLAGAAVLLALLAVAALLAGLAPWHLWRRGAHAIGYRWLYASGAALAATLAILLSQDLWAPTAQVTFDLVRFVLVPFVPALHADPATRILAAPHFAVEVSQICSGLEGVGLILAFCTAWLIFFRAEYRFPRALLLIPAGVVLVFALNVIRIAALVLIGNAGHPATAIFGFHSQAGWISFNVVACGVAFVSRRSRWLNVTATARTEAAAARATVNPTAAYLMPLLAVLAAGMISRSGSGRFETWYALRLLAGGAALAIYWPRLGTLDWRFSWRAAVAGLGIFGLWLGASLLLLPAQKMPAALAAMSTLHRVLWVAGRVATAVVVLPLVEELAYRGYLLRRLVAADFEAVSFTAVGWIALLVTSLAFGLLGGALWPAGIAAGIVLGALLIRTGRIGEAAAAHIVANILLCATVLLGHQWQLW